MSPLSSTGRFFKTEDGRIIMLRGVNLSGSVKQPFTPLLPSHETVGFFDGENVSFVSRPFPLGEAETHFKRLASWGFNFLRFNITWEAVEHSGPGIYDQEYLDYLVEILKEAKKHGFRCFIDPHQDVWSRFSGGSGAPLWTLEKAGFDVTKFADTCAALCHSQSPDPEQFPKMIWPTNYYKLACLTMFTLFFGGKTFAPKFMVAGVNIQEYLQSHYFNSICQVVKAVKNAGLDDNCVVGYDTLNEPSLGLIGIEDITILAHQQEMRKGLTPTPLQTMKMGMGFKTENVEVWDMTSVGPQKQSETTIDPKGVSCWAKGYSCIWADHGVWDLKSKECLRKDYFYQNKETGAIYDGLGEFWKPFVNRFTESIRALQPNAIIFVEPPVNAFPPVFEEGDVKGRLCFAPHWYDGLTLIQKHWNPWFNVDYVGFTRGKYSSIAFAVKFGEAAIKKCFQSQLRMLREEGEVSLGSAYPTVIGEIGIPYDMDGKAAYLSGDYNAQINAMDANMTALEKDLLNFTIWNYCPDNSHKWGDQWNGEDLSIWSPPISSLLSPSMDQKTVDLNAGARALIAFCRPFPIHTPGIPKFLSFDLKTITFTYSFTHLTNEDSSWDPKAAGITCSDVEIFLPKLHYPRIDEIDIWVSHGTLSISIEEQKLTWNCKCKQTHQSSDASSATTGSGSIDSARPLVGTPIRTKTSDSRVHSDESIVHKIVVKNRVKGIGASAIGKMPEANEDEEGVCPQCLVM